MNTSITRVTVISSSFYICIFLLVRCSNSLTEFPEADISNGLIYAKVYLPDKENGYYQGTRFDWSGVIPSLEYKGHSYFGKWFEKYNPKTHDAIMGPVEEFVPIGYENAKPGAVFLKIGVGALIKPNDNAYRFSVHYEVKDYGDWSIKKKKDEVEFIHEMKDVEGYSYVYHKKLTVIKGKPEMLLEHILKNTGVKSIETKSYNHNFFMIDEQSVGPDYSVTFPFDLNLKGDPVGIGSIADIEDNKLIYNRTLNQGESVYCFLEGYGKDTNDYDIRIENSKTGAGVRITSDRSLSYLVFCPSPPHYAQSLILISMWLQVKSFNGPSAMNFMLRQVSLKNNHVIIDL